MKINKCHLVKEKKLILNSVLICVLISTSNVTENIIWFTLALRRNSYVKGEFEIKWIMRSTLKQRNNNNDIHHFEC